MSEIVFNPPKPGNTTEADLKSQIENLQTTLASLNQQVITLQEALQERDQKIAELQTKLATKENTSQVGSDSWEVEGKAKRDDTLTIVGLLINLYQSVFMSGKETA